MFLYKPDLINVKPTKSCIQYGTLFNNIFLILLIGRVKGGKSKENTKIYKVTI